MACEAVQLWTFNGLVAAFLDLGIAYLLLCASSLIFFAAKFLALFGLCLPCPCDGLFGNLSSDHCFQKLLVDRSSKKISSVLHSAIDKFPLNSMWEQEPTCCFKSKLLHDKEALVELEGEASGSSFVKTKSPQGMIYGDFYSVKESRCEGGVDHRKVISVLQSDVEDFSQSPLSFTGFGDDDTEDGFFSVDSGDGREEASSDNSDQCKVFPARELDESYDEKIWAEKYGAFFEEVGNDRGGELCLDGNESDTIKLLERALEEEHMARTTLYVELEKERSAAASAADEAMAMILRLQEEKASIEMDARQYQRMIEEKTAYDAEEMSILKEILVRREREMHFLEKEVEAFQKSFFDDDGVDGDMLDSEVTPHKAPLFPYSTEDPSHMLRSIRDKQDANYTKHSSQFESPSMELKLSFEFGEESPFIQADKLADAAKAGGMLLQQVDNFKDNDNEEIENELQEKSMVEDENLYIIKGEANELEPCLLSNESSGLGKVEKSMELIADEVEKVDEVSYDGLESAKTILPCVEYNLKKNSDLQKQQTRDVNSLTDTDPHPHDIHAINDEASADARIEPMVNGTSSIPAKYDSPSFSLLQSELDIPRSNSDATGRFPPVARTRSNCLRSEMRRNSMSAVDYERSKIGNEVEWLRERLKIVQKGRETLKFSVEHKEKENNQVELLENITNHLREIRQLTNPGKATLHAPLPPSSKAMSKNRCWRSSSLSIHRSS